MLIQYLNNKDNVLLLLMSEMMFCLLESIEEYDAIFLFWGLMMILIV